MDFLCEKIFWKREIDLFRDFENLLMCYIVFFYFFVIKNVKKEKNRDFKY